MNPILAQIQTLLAQLGFPSSGSTNVPQIQWTTAGLVIPSEAAVLAGVLLDWNTVANNNFNPQFNSSQGTLISAQAAAISNCYALVALIVAGVDPDMNYGFMQDVIGRIYYQNRSPGTPTVVSCAVNGLSGSPIPSNAAIAQDSSGNQYICQTVGASIPISGNITLTFANTVNGPIPCAANSVELIQAITGIDSITNPAVGVPGTLVESSEAFEFQREQSVASNSQGLTASIQGAVIGLPGVIDCYTIDNPTGSAVLIGSTGFSVAKNSVYVGVIGGTSTAIAQAIWSKKSLGCNYNGNTTVTVTDTSVPTNPTYPVSYNNNAENPVTYNLTINIKNNSLLPATITADVQAAAAAAFVGTLPNTQRIHIGSLFTPISSIAPSVTVCEGPSIPVQIEGIFIGSAFTGTGTLVNGSNVLTIATATANTLSAGTPVKDSAGAIPASTYIVQQLTGTVGGAGTYQMSANATATEASPEAVAGTATGTSAAIGIDQAPVLGVVTVNLV
jgi:hypothetical protein